MLLLQFLHIMKINLIIRVYWKLPSAALTPRKASRFWAFLLNKKLKASMADCPTASESPMKKSKYEFPVIEGATNSGVAFGAEELRETQ